MLLSITATVQFHEGARQVHTVSMTKVETHSLSDPPEKNVISSLEPVRERSDWTIDRIITSSLKMQIAHVLARADKINALVRDEGELGQAHFDLRKVK